MEFTARGLVVGTIRSVKLFLFASRFSNHFFLFIPMDVIKPSFARKYVLLKPMVKSRNPNSGDLVIPKGHRTFINPQR
jgi:hypothetical protein